MNKHEAFNKYIEKFGFNKNENKIVKCNERVIQKREVIGYLKMRGGRRRC